MAAVANNPAFAKKVGIKSSVGEEFIKADKGKKFGTGGMTRPDVQKVNKPKQIRPFTKYLKKVINDEGIARVTILTARSAYEPVKKYLKDIGMGDVYIVTLASNDPQKKADWIESQIEKGYDDIFFLDDSRKNVDAVKKLQKKYPEIRLVVQQAKETF